MCMRSCKIFRFFDFFDESWTEVSIFLAGAIWVVKVNKEDDIQREERGILARDLWLIEIKLYTGMHANMKLGILTFSESRHDRRTELKYS